MNGGAWGAVSARKRAKASGRAAETWELDGEKAVGRDGSATDDPACGSANRNIPINLYLTQSPPRFVSFAVSALFVYFYQIPKKLKLFSQNPLTTLALCDKIVNCIIIALTMGTSALSQGSLSMKGDFFEAFFVHFAKDTERAFHTTLTVAFAVSLGCPFDP